MAWKWNSLFATVVVGMGLVALGRYLGLGHVIADDWTILYRTRPALNCPATAALVSQDQARSSLATQTYDPYHVWISEIMLQQTQMDRGVAYFLRWIERFADVQGGGQQQTNRRFSNTGKGLVIMPGQEICIRRPRSLSVSMVGRFPVTTTSCCSLPGIGPYTAAAIASVAGNYDVPVIDANVARVYARLFNIGEPVKDRPVQKRLAEIAEKLLPHGQARAYNQALMDLGGLVCTPKNPDCPKCPVAGSCEALRAGTVAERPVLGPKKKIITLYKVAGIICFNGKIFIQQRRGMMSGADSGNFRVVRLRKKKKPTPGSLPRFTKIPDCPFISYGQLPESFTSTPTTK